MAHTIANCRFAGLNLGQIEADFAAGNITGMGYHHLKEHVDGCPFGCQPIRAGQPPPMQRYRRQARPDTRSNNTSPR